MATLNEILATIQHLLDVPYDELTEEEQAELDEALQTAGQAEADKVDGIAQFLQLETAHIKAIKEESARLATRAKTAQAKIDRYKMYLLASLESKGLKKLCGDIYTLSTRKSMSVQVQGKPEDLPEEYRTTTVSVAPNKTAIGAHLKTGVLIPNCRLVQGVSLQVK